MPYLGHDVKQAQQKAGIGSAQRVVRSGPSHPRYKEAQKYLKRPTPFANPSEKRAPNAKPTTAEKREAARKAANKARKRHARRNRGA
jgi:hypothetical protein